MSAPSPVAYAMLRQFRTACSSTHGPRAQRTLDKRHVLRRAYCRDLASEDLCDLVPTHAVSVPVVSERTRGKAPALRASQSLRWDHRTPKSVAGIDNEPCWRIAEDCSAVHPGNRGRLRQSWKTHSVCLGCYLREGAWLLQCATPRLASWLNSADPPGHAT
eukprot:3372685-Rhodomonas_salina.1